MPIRAKSFIDKSAGPDGCWLWTQTTAPEGYGIFIHGSHSYRAHRLAWEFTHTEPLGEFDVICHRCDNPQCVNPAHLFVGTPKDNYQDMVNKGRHAFRLTDAEVREIRALYATGQFTSRQLGERFGCSKTHVLKLARGDMRVEAGGLARNT